MIEALLRHCTDAEIEANYVDTHGVSIVGFAFTELLGFRLLPRWRTSARSGRTGATTRPPRPTDPSR
ncbi:Tn3 family transposase [Amycolatopsis aidingensis]|uniref:Tn3 family transposase n=1 Tax=Amycolatopsis aidingensis TaxID=2842453 RepID=UPI0038CC1A7C